MHELLGKPIDHIKDGENNAVEFDVAYPLKSGIHATLEQLRSIHGDDLLLLPMSATSSGGGIFQHHEKPEAPVVGLRFDAPLNPRLGFASQPELLAIEQDEIIIDRENQQIYAGAAITLQQLNRALADELGHNYKVPGADLTSYMYAAVGATFMTGGMGPQRRYFSDSVQAIALFDGNELRQVEGEDLSAYSGTYGWSGMVCALRCNYSRFPVNEIAFALPVSSEAAQLARLLQQLAAYAYLDLSSGRAISQRGDDLVLGVEHVSCDSMQPLLCSPDNPSYARAVELQDKCNAAGVDGLVFISGFSERSSDEFLIDLVDDENADPLCIAGINIEHAEVFGDPEEMRAVREAVPYTARTQGGGGRFLYKNHSDANIRMHPDEVGSCSEKLWRINCAYIERVQDYFASEPAVNGQILVYGHLNPYGIDPHNRVTMSTDDESAFQACREFLLEQRAQFYRDLVALCVDSKAILIGGEKSADSEIGIYAAVGGPQNAPVELYERYRQQRRSIASANRMFSWRALPPYC